MRDSEQRGAGWLVPPTPSECGSELQAAQFRLILAFMQSERLTEGCSLVLEFGVVPATIAACLRALPTVGSEAELRTALADESRRSVLVKAGARIELPGGDLTIRRSVRLVGGAGGALPVIAGAQGKAVLRIIGRGRRGVAVELEALRIEVRRGCAIWCDAWASLAADRCQVLGGAVRFDDRGTTGALRECLLVGSGGGYALGVQCGASVSVEGGAMHGCDGIGVHVSGFGARATVRCRPPLPFGSHVPLPARFPPRFFGPLVSQGSFL